MNLLDSFQHILLIENCHFTLGANRSLLVDNQRHDMHFFDNEIFKIFDEKSRSKCLNEIFMDYSDEEKTIISDYFSFMIENEIAFLCDKDEVDMFPKMNRIYEVPELISNCIIDFNNEPNDIIYYKSAIQELDMLGCENLEIRDFFGLSIPFLENLLQLFNNTVIHRIELILKFSDYSVEEYQELVLKNARINSLTLHSCHGINLDEINEIESDQKICYHVDQIKDNSHCGIISPNYFNLDLRHTVESLKYNTCLNKKITIDVNGDIKNCPSMKTSYGNIKTHKLAEIALKPEFQQIWGINKEKINICNVCEFRNICTDCRAFQNDVNSLEKPTKCSYNPYLMVWES